MNENTYGRSLSCMLMAGLVVPWAFAGTQVIPLNDVQTVRADADTTLSDTCYLSGTLQKLGAGRLTIPAEKLYGVGRILVSEGELAITTSSSDTDPIDAPAALQRAALWLDANQHVVADGADVKRWFDVRETNWQQASFVTNYIYAQSYNNLAKDGAWPTLAMTNGLPSLFFGGVQSGQWMRWNTPTGTNAWIGVVHSFVVLDLQGHHGHYLGSSSNENGHDQFLATSSGSDGTTYFDTPCQSPAPHSYVRMGRVFSDGLPVDPCDEIDRSRAQLLETAAYSRNGNWLMPRADCFFNFRNYQQSAGSYQNGDRVGGSGIHEAIVFTNSLTEVERTAVEQYLLRKWLRCGDYAACRPTLVISPNATLAPLPSVLDGKLDIVCEGLRKVTPGGDLSPGDKVKGPECVVSVTGNGVVSNRAGYVFANLGAGKTLSVDVTNTVTIADGVAATFEKQGLGSLALADLSDAETVSLAGRTRFVAPSVSAETPVALTNNCVRDGGFEGIYTGTGIQVYKTGDRFGAWVSDAWNSGSGATRIQYKTGWQYLCNTDCVPEGNYYLLLKQGAAAWQTVDLPADGRYVITLRCTPRENDCAYARVSIDGFALGTVQSRSGEPEWDAARLVTPSLTKGEHVLRLSYDSSEDSAIGIDDIRMHWLEAGADVPVPNGNFEDFNWVYNDGDPRTSEPNKIIQSFFYATGGTNPKTTSIITNWTCTGRVFFVRRAPYLQCATGMTIPSGMSEAIFRGPVNDSGCFSAVLQAAYTSGSETETGVGGQVSQVLTAPRTGFYRLSAKACRYDIVAGWGKANTVNVGNLVLSLNGTSQQFSLPGHLLKRFALSEPVYCQAGDPLTLVVKVADLPTSADAVDTIAIDDVRLEEVHQDENLLTNPSFENYSGEQDRAITWLPTGWSVDNPANKQIIYKLGLPITDYFSSVEVPDGSCCLRLHSSNRVSQVVNVWEVGVYRLGFWASCRVDHGTPHYGPAPLIVSVSREGVTNFCENVVPPAIDRYLRHEYYVRLPVAGTYTVSFQAEPSTEDLSTMLDAVSFRRVRFDATKGFGLHPEAKIALAADATLALDYPGTNGVASVRRPGGLHGTRQTVAGETVVVIDAAANPGVIYGVGALSRPSHGAVIIVR